MLTGRFLSVLLGCALVLGATVNASADVRYSQSVKYYDIGPRKTSRQAIWNAVRHEGAAATGRSAIGTARAQTKWNYRIKGKGQRCSIVDLNIDLHVTITLPEWDAQHGKARKLKNYFACVQDTVTVHENRHATIAREMADKLNRTLKRRFNNVACAGFKDRIQRVSEKISRKTEGRQHAFDRADARAGHLRRCNRLGNGRYRKVASARSISAPRRSVRRQRTRNWLDETSGRSERPRRKSQRRADARDQLRDDDRTPSSRGASDAEPRAEVSVSKTRRRREREIRGQSIFDDVSPNFLMLGILLSVFSIVVWVVFKASRRPAKVDDDEGGADWQERAFESIRNGGQFETAPTAASGMASRQVNSEAAPSGKPAVVFGRR